MKDQIYYVDNGKGIREIYGSFFLQHWEWILKWQDEWRYYFWQKLPINVDSQIHTQTMSNTNGGQSKRRWAMQHRLCGKYQGAEHELIQNIRNEYKKKQLTEIQGKIPKWNFNGIKINPRLTWSIYIVCTS